MSTINLFFKAIESYVAQINSDPNDRLRSWEHCYKSFHDARGCKTADQDYLSLMLAFYLAMYRGSSFLLQKDYKIHRPVVEEILKPQYDSLFGIECIKLRETEQQKQLQSLCSNMSEYYDGIRKTVKSNDVKNKLSDTLITKVLMGTLGCVPAYDRFFVEGVKSQGVTIGNYSIKSLLNLVDFYESNTEHLEKCRKNLFAYDLQYPQMKLIDMGFWQIGFDKAATPK